MRGLYLFLLIFTLLFAGKCHNRSQEESQATSLTSYIGLRWQLQSINGSLIDTSEFLHAVPHLFFNDSTALSGSTGCNSFSGIYAIGPDSTFLSLGAMTKMACPGTFERRFQKTVEYADSVSFSSDSLFLYHGSTSLMIFVNFEESK